MIRCPSCEHGADIHDMDGRCWFTVSSGLPETNLVCPCKIRMEHEPDCECGGWPQG